MKGGGRNERKGGKEMEIGRELTAINREVYRGGKYRMYM